MKARLRYLILFIILFLTEILIGVFLKGGFIRAYGGDILVLPLLYTFLRIFFSMTDNFTKKKLPFLLFLFGAFVEGLQGLHIADILHITSPLLRIIIGSTFDYLDIGCYFVGMLLIYGGLYEGPRILYIKLTLQQISCKMKTKRIKIQMNRIFKEVPSFTKKWYALGLTDDDLRVLEDILLKNPKTGDTIAGTGGIRKIRIPMEDTGKRGGGRVIYVDIEVKECIYLIDVYTKKEKSDLTDKERKMLRRLVEALKEE